MPRISKVVAIGLAAALGSLAAPAHAYLVDANDARVVAPGTLELELQPAGYFQTLIGDEKYYLAAPSAQIYVGLAERWDMLFLTRGYVGLGGTARQSPYALPEQFLAFRALLAHGSYSSEGGHDGLSLALQMGVFLPGVEAETGFGSTGIRHPRSPTTTPMNGPLVELPADRARTGSGVSTARRPRS